MHQDGKYVLPVSRIHGHVGGDYLLFMSKSFERQAGSIGDILVGFDSEQAAREFHAFWVSKYGIALTRAWKVDIHVYPQYIPYFWATRGKEARAIQDYFGLDSEELDYLLSMCNQYILQCGP